MLSLYRRHNPKRCTSGDSQRCEPVGNVKRRHPCPIWVRGFLEIENRYVRQPLSTRDWKRALEEVRAMEAGLQSTITPAPPQPATPKVTIQDWHTAFIDNAKVENISSETLRKYELLFRQLTAFATNKGYRFPSELDLQALQQFRATWKDGPLSKTKKQERLRSIFKFAVKQKWVVDNPSLDLGKVKGIESTQKTPFSQTEIESILKHAQQKSATVYTFILVMRFSGLRISDVAMLKVSSLQGEHLVLRTAKTGTDVKVLLPKIVADALRKIPKRHPEYFFWDGQSKLSSVTDYWRNRQIKPVFVDAKIPKAHPHRFRHTFAVELLRQGTSVTYVADLLGNTERIVQRHYSAWTEARQKNLDEVVRKANGYHSLKPI